MVAKFFAPVQKGRGAQPAPHTVRTGSCPGVKQPGRGVDHSLPSSAESEEGERVESRIYSPFGPSRPVIG